MFGTAPVCWVVVPEYALRQRIPCPSHIHATPQHFLHSCVLTLTPTSHRPLLPHQGACIRATPAPLQGAGHFQLTLTQTEHTEHVSSGI